MSVYQLESLPTIRSLDMEDAKTGTKLRPFARFANIAQTPTR